MKLPNEIKDLELKRPLVSVVIPTKDREKIIGQAIKSVLRQENVNIQLIIVNDGSSDQTSDFIKKEYPAIHLIENKNSVGGAIARNIGAEVATGEFIAFLDSDDEWTSKHLITKIKTLENSKAEGVYGSFFLSDHKISKEIKFHESYPAEYGIGDKIASFATHDARTSTFVFKRKTFNLIKFDEKLKKHQDWDLAINFQKNNNFVLDKNPTTVIHVNSFHSRMSNSLNHESTLYFLRKNKNNLQVKGYYNFCLKMVMYCQSLEDTQFIQNYLELMKDAISNLGHKEKLIYLSLKYRLINLDYIRRITYKFRH